VLHRGVDFDPVFMIATQIAGEAKRRAGKHKQSL
jgi:hypothetical protein